MDAKGIPVAGTFEDLCKNVDIMLDSSPGGVGAKNKEIYEKLGVKAIFQGGREEFGGGRVFPRLRQL